MTQQPPPPSRYSPTDSFERNLQRIRLRQDTHENWLKNDPIPASGELCYTIGSGDPGQVLKVGDGNVPWSQLPYLAAKGDSGYPGKDGEDGHGITVYGPSDNPPSPVNTQLYDGDMWLSNGIWEKNPSFDPNLITPGAKGDSGEIVGVSAVGLAAGSSPTVNNIGTTTEANFVFGIPEGDQGPPGIQGPIGITGPEGPAGETFKISGAVPSEDDLPPDPPALTVYVTQDTSHLYIYDPGSAAALPSGYVDLGSIAGPQGEPTFYSNPVATAADLPDTGAAGQCIMALDTGHMHSWNPSTSSWVDAGKIRGPAGDGIPDGTDDGQFPIWSVTYQTWQPTMAELDMLADVIAPSPGDGEVLTYDSNSGSWVNSPVTHPPGTIVADTEPADSPDGTNWFDTVRLELFVKASDAWLPSSPLGARVAQGEIVQAQLLERVTTGEQNQNKITADVRGISNDISSMNIRVQQNAGRIANNEQAIEELQALPDPIAPDVDKAYVDSELAKKIGNTGEQNLPTDSWKLRARKTANDGNYSYLSIENDYLHLYHVADPTNDAHGVSRGYCDGRYSRKQVPVVMKTHGSMACVTQNIPPSKSFCGLYNTSPGSSTNGNPYFGNWNSDIRVNIDGLKNPEGQQFAVGESYNLSGFVSIFGAEDGKLYFKHAITNAARSSSHDYVQLHFASRVPAWGMGEYNSQSKFVLVVEGLMDKPVNTVDTPVEDIQ